MITIHHHSLESCKNSSGGLMELEERKKKEQKDAIVCALRPSKKNTLFARSALLFRHRSFCWTHGHGGLHARVYTRARQLKILECCLAWFVRRAAPCKYVAKARMHACCPLRLYAGYIRICGGRGSETRRPYYLATQLFSLSLSKAAFSLSLSLPSCL